MRAGGTRSSQSASRVGGLHRPDTAGAARKIGRCKHMVHAPQQRPNAESTQFGRRVARHQGQRGHARLPLSSPPISPSSAYSAPHGWPSQRVDPSKSATQHALGFRALPASVVVAQRQPLPMQSIDWFDGLLWRAGAFRPRRERHLGSRPPGRSLSRFGSGTRGPLWSEGAAVSTRNPIPGAP